MRRGSGGVRQTMCSSSESHPEHRTLSLTSPLGVCGTVLHVGLATADIYIAEEHPGESEVRISVAKHDVRGSAAGCGGCERLQSWMH